jgi:hypothetical protein
MKLLGFALLALCFFMAGCMAAAGAKDAVDGKGPQVQAPGESLGQYLLYVLGFGVASTALTAAGIVTHGAVSQPVVRALVDGLASSAPVAPSAAPDPTPPAAPPAPKTG